MAHLILQLLVLHFQLDDAPGVIRTPLRRLLQLKLAPFELEFSLSGISLVLLSIVVTPLIFTLRSQQISLALGILLL